MTVDPRLQALRDRIDAIDVKLMDLLRARADIVEQVRGVKGSLPIYIRPGREADMMRVILRMPMGHIPHGLIHRLWREMIGAFTLQEGRLRVAVAVEPGFEGVWDYARDHFGVFTPLAEFPGAVLALAAVRDGEAEVAAIAAPGKGRSWWRSLLDADMARIKIFYRFPFDGIIGNARPSHTDALALADLAPEKTQSDRTVLLVEWRGASPRDLSSLPHSCAAHIVHENCSWIELDGFHLDDPALDAWCGQHKEDILRCRIAGAYPVPFSY